MADADAARTMSTRRDRPAAVTLIAALGVVFGLLYLVAVPGLTFWSTISNEFPQSGEVASDGVTTGASRTGDADAPPRTEAEAAGRDDERATAGAFTMAATLFGAAMGFAALLGALGSLKLLPIARNAMNIWAAATIGFVLIGAVAVFFSTDDVRTLAVTVAVLLATLAYAAAVLVVYRRPEVRAAFGG